MYDKAGDGELSHVMNRFGILWNWCVEIYGKVQKRTGKIPSGYLVMSHIARMKHRPKWSGILEGLPSQAVQNVVERVDRSYRVHIKWLASGRKGIERGAPRFRKVRKYASFTLKQAGYKFDWESGKVRICGRWYGFFNSSRMAKGKVKTVTVKRDRVGDWYVVIVTDYERSQDIQKTGRAIGFDFGMKHFLTASDGTTIDAPLFMQRHRKEQRKLYRALSRKKLHSRGWWKCKDAIARFNRKIANQRHDFQWKLARDVVRKYDLVCIEDLNLIGMARFRFGRKVGEYGFASFVSKLEYLASTCGKEVVKVGRYFASSQLCHKCGHQHKGLTLKDREWTCSKCGTHHDRDVNAAMNILSEGASSVGEGSGKTDSLRKEVAALTV